MMTVSDNAFLFDMGKPSSSDAAMGSTVSDRSSASLMDARRLKEFRLLLGDLSAVTNIHFYTGGNWSLNELIAYLLSVTGPADIYFSSWAIREDAIRSMINWKKSGYAKSIHAVLDKRTSQRDAAVILMCQSNFDSCRFVSCHAKITVLMNEQWSITVNGSQNYTKNPRIECGVISLDKNVAGFHLNWIKNV